jgi:hypothetical protein
VPDQPFVEALASFAHSRDTHTLRQELGSGANEVARIVPAVRNLLQIEPSGPESPEDDRLRLLSGVVNSLQNIAAAHPLLLVLEDLHDADRGTLDLQVYLARHLSRTPLLVVGTYRDVEVDRAHPLSAALGELRRVSQFERVHLGELKVEEYSVCWRIAVSRLFRGRSLSRYTVEAAEIHSSPTSSCASSSANVFLKKGTER